MPSGLQTLTYGPDLAKNRAWALATGLGSKGPSLGLGSARPTEVHADLLASTDCLGLALCRQGQTQHQCLSRDQECWESGELSSSSSFLPPFLTATLL